MKQLRQSKDHKYIPMTSITSGNGVEVRDDVYYYTNQIVNIVFVGNPEDDSWVMIDAGMPKQAAEIIAVTEERFGIGSRPSAIILTHGHFDHVGSIVSLIEHWNVPVYAHFMEFPFLTGKMSYPEPDTSVDGGLLAKISFIYPHKAIDIENALVLLPEDGTVPYMPGWKWIHTPGHTDGHVSFFREDDGLMLSGDAFITVRQDSLYRVLMQTKEVNGPPRYLTTNWQAAWESVRILEALHPQTVIAGHGSFMEGKELSKGLKRLADEFDKLAIPEKGKFVDEKK